MPYSLQTGRHRCLRGLRREAGRLKYLVRMVDDGVDAGDLLEHCEAYADQQCATLLLAEHLGAGPLAAIMRQRLCRTPPSRAMASAVG